MFGIRLRQEEGGRISGHRRTIEWCLLNMPVEDLRQQDGIAEGKQVG